MKHFRVMALELAKISKIFVPIVTTMNYVKIPFHVVGFIILYLSML